MTLEQTLTWASKWSSLPSVESCSVIDAPRRVGRPGQDSLLFLCIEIIHDSYDIMQR